MNYEETKQWFIERINKQVFRDKTSCECETCKRITEEGLIVRDEFHAIYLTDVSHQAGIKYRDEK